MERHRCKLCFRRFANGRALAGHMRSHHVVPARAPRPLPSPSPSASSSSPLAATAAEAEEEVKPSAMYALRENRRESFFSSSAAAAFQDRGSDTESSIRRWPKRRRRLPAEPPAADEPVSSVSDASPDEDVARCLMLLSRDAWSKCKAEGRHTNGWDEIEGEAYEEEEEEEEDEEEDGIGSRSRRPKSRFQCGMCRKVFRSYQALGGHRASHKRVGANCVPSPAGMRIHGEDSSGTTAAHHDAKLWECPYCYRVFVSGQALGGHKRSHLSSSAAATATATASTSPAVPLLRPPSPFTSAANNDTNSGIDLNLPAPDDEAELSVVSIATESARK